MLIVRFALVLGLILAVNAVTGGVARPARAVAVAGEAYALAAGAPPAVIGGSPSVSLPASGGSVNDATPGSGVGLGSGAGNADGLSATASGDANAGVVSSTVGVDVVELFGGVIRATDLRVTAAASVEGRGSAGSSLTATSLTVGGLVYTDARPNTRVELPGIGYAVLNEQLVGGDGAGAASAEINAIHLFVTVPSALGVPGGTEIVVAHAAAGVPDVNATREVASGALPAATPVPWAPLSALAPINISIGDNDLGNDNDIEFGNGNGNDNGGTTAATGGASLAGGTGSSGSPIAVTVVVVVVTNTATPTVRPGAPATATSTATRTPTRTP